MASERYGPEEIEYALTTLSFFRGDVKKAAGFLKIPSKLLGKWQEDAEKRTGAGAAPAVRIFAPGGRPNPPEAFLDYVETGGMFEPARELAEWVHGAFLTQGSPLYNEEHSHLEGAHIGYLWTNVACRRKGMAVAGTAEIPNVQGPVWTKRRMEYQLQGWFGAVPSFLIILDASYAAEASDARFCALIEHELLHCGQAKDPFGEPRWTEEDQPVFCIRGHDVEEFVSIVRRYGAGNGAGATQALVQAASRPPELVEADIASVCGTCLR